MEISQENSICSYLYLKLKFHVFYFLFSLFSPTKPDNGKTEQVLPRGEGWHQEEGEVLRKGGRMVSTVQ
jgi:hypothetical protein